MGCSGRINIGEKYGKRKRRMWGQQDFLKEETVDFLMEMCKNEEDKLWCFFVHFVNVKESEIIVYHQSKIVLHEQEGLWCFFVHFLLI